jgi:diaminopimelate decarboxylase
MENIFGVNMGIMKQKQIEEEMEKEQEPQHVIDERKVEEAIERMHDQRQWDMYNDELWNWSGLR